MRILLAIGFSVGLIAIAVAACGNDATTLLPTPSRTAWIPDTPSMSVNVCAGEPTRPLCDPDFVVEHSIITLQGPDEPHIIERSESKATMIRRDEVEAEVLSRGVDSIPNFRVELWSYDLWLVEIRGEFDGPPYRGAPTLGFDRVTGTVFTVVDLASGLTEPLAFLAD